MLDSRRHLRQFFDYSFRHSVSSGIFKFLASLAAALVIAYLPEYTGLSGPGVSTLFILFFAALLWITEAIPAFSVALLIIALEIVILGFPGFDFATGSKAWEIYLKPWSSPLVFLFLAGFIMAAAASKTKLDLWLAKRVLFFAGETPHRVMIGLVAITFVMSMFMSNTATTAMMMAVLLPIMQSMEKGNPFQKAILLGVTVAANIGGLGTIIGTPPNAIAVGVLGDKAPSFLGWMLIALPPAVVMMTILSFVLIRLYPSTETRIDLGHLRGVQHFDDSTRNFSPVPTVPSWKKSVVVGVFAVTILLWLTGPLHHIPTTVVSLLPIVAFTIVGIIDVDDIRELRWDVIILIIGGLSLGLAVAKTGLAAWFAGLFPLEHVALTGIVALFSVIIVIVSNFMSNTAATNIILPLVVALAIHLDPSDGRLAVIAVAMCASFAMALPVSTPPNAIVYASGRIDAKDFLKIGLITGVLGPLIVLGWMELI